MRTSVQSLFLASIVLSGIWKHIINKNKSSCAASGVTQLFSAVLCSEVVFFIHTFVHHAKVFHPNRLLQQTKGSTTGSFLSFAPHVWQVQDSDITCTFQMWSVIYVQALAPTGIRPAAEFSSSIISKWSMACLLLWSVYLFLGEKWTQSRNNSVV